MLMVFIFVSGIERALQATDDAYTKSVQGKNENVVENTSDEIETRYKRDRIEKWVCKGDIHRKWLPIDCHYISVTQ